MTKSLLVSKREYLKVIKKKSFWFTSLAFPIFIFIVSLISGATATEEKSDISQVENISKVLIMDESGLIDSDLEIFNNKIYKLVSSKQESIYKVKTAEADLFIFYPSDFVDSKQAELYFNDKGIFSNSEYELIANHLVEQSILSEIKDDNKTEILNSEIKFNKTNFKDGKEFEIKTESLVVVGIFVFLTFIFMTFATGYFLLSVSEEKENRMIETILSIMKPKELILGKIVGQLGIVITQIVVVLGLALLAVILSPIELPIDISELNFDIALILYNSIILILGYIILSNIMVGVGSAMPTYKEAQGLASIFIMISILPIYFINLMINNPESVLAYFLSYFPLTSSFTLIARTALVEISLMEKLISIFILIIYCLISYKIAYSLFELGSLEYNKTISKNSLKSALARKKLKK